VLAELRKKLGITVKNYQTTQTGLTVAKFLQDAKERGVDIKTQSVPLPSSSDIRISSETASSAFYLRITQPGGLGNPYQFDAGTFLSIPSASAIQIGLTFDFDYDENNNWTNLFNGSDFGGSLFGAPPEAALSYFIYMGYLLGRLVCRDPFIIL
jgi:hypothetical protein